MFRRFYTVMIVPHEGGTLRRLSVSMNFIVSMAGIFLFCFVSSAFLAHFFIGGMHRPDQTQLLRVELERANLEVSHLRAENQNLAINVDMLTSRFEELRRVKSAPGEPVDAMGGALVGERDAGDLAIDGDWRGATQSANEKIEYWKNWADEEICETTALLECIPRGWPVLGRITSGTGWRRDPITGGRQYHEGVDIAAAHGTPIRAQADGVVVEARRRGGYGNMVRVDHGLNESGQLIETIYGHMRRMHVHEGDRIQKGDLLGEVGSTGHSTGPHLHYEVLEDGVPVDPRREYLH